MTYLIYWKGSAGNINYNRSRLGNLALDFFQHAYFEICDLSIISSNWYDIWPAVRSAQCHVVRLCSLGPDMHLGIHAACIKVVHVIKTAQYTDCILQNWKMCVF